MLSPPEDLETYLELDLATCARTGARPHPPRVLQGHLAPFIPQRLARILFAQRDGSVIAARNFSVYKAARSPGPRPASTMPARWGKSTTSMGSDANIR